MHSRTLGRSRCCADWQRRQFEARTTSLPVSRMAVSDRISPSLEKNLIEHGLLRAAELAYVTECEARFEWFLLVFGGYLVSEMRCENGKNIKHDSSTCRNCLVTSS